uniref:Uncharacterized protein n=1 Tax=Roseihalotalea indica TaxID=2867963 RepID=A0AA49GTF3_9BACT|nr:hypothetical protein K4G66_00790 [Tunicatimonas sp. TK19036]
MTLKIYKVLLILGAIGWFYIHAFSIDKLFKKHSDLTEKDGVIEFQELIRTSGKGNNKAVVLKLKSQDLQFAVHDKYERAFQYLSKNRVQNHTVRILYDPEGYNSKANLTFHIYELHIDNQELLDIEESKFTEKIGLLILIGFDIFFLCIYLWIRKISKQIRIDEVGTSG